jgi:hypothetical protein
LSSGFEEAEAMFACSMNLQTYEMIQTEESRGVYNMHLSIDICIILR